MVVGDGNNGRGGLFDRKPELRPDLLVDGRPCPFDIEREALAAGNRVVTVDPPQHHVGIGDGRLFTAPSVTHRPRLGPGALRTHLQHSSRVDPRDAAATGPDCMNVDHRHHNGDAELQLPAA